MQYDRQNETIEQVQETIQFLEQYLEGSRAAEGKDLGPFAHVYGREAVQSAKAQLAFERTRLEALSRPV